MKIDPEEFQVQPGTKVDLDKWATRMKPFYKSEKGYKELLAADVGELSDLQKLLYASNSHSLLLIFQAMDAAGKDGVIGHVLTGINPQGCEVHGFKQPSVEESQHDFLWRTTCRLAVRGKICVFNRSYYEEVLVVRVHPKSLGKEGVSEVIRPKDSFWKERFRSIVELERHLDTNNTRVLKFFLHLSKDEQRKRFLKRIDEPDKNWKFSEADIAERELWDAYMKAYEHCLGATSTKAAPWHVVPADDKLNARLIVSRIVIEALRNLKMSYPLMTLERRAELQEIRKKLAT